MAGPGFTGGTLQIGNASTAAAQTIGIISTNPVYNLQVNSANATAILQTIDLSVSNNVTVTAGALNINSRTLKIGGDISNSGAFTASNGKIEMNGAAAQTIPASTFASNLVKDQ
jgi:phage baseplate assembly protein gpV